MFDKQLYPLDEKKSDVYSVGVLLWEISSGKPPFYVEGQPYNNNLAGKILQGYRESVVPDTPADYVKLYTGKSIVVLFKLICYIKITSNDVCIFSLFRMLGRRTR